MIRKAEKIEKRDKNSLMMTIAIAWTSEYSSQSKTYASCNLMMK
jgi:hypothetical protein